ncbi:MAG TPA: prenyltransferase [Gammaproteobacteria bacterium]|nr:prenyltransferase [Gammaproteobacteria bacterium]
MTPEVREGIWRLADPKISITSLAAMLVGMAPAVRGDQYSLAWLAVTAAALFCMEVAKNAWGDVIDFDSGTDLAVRPEDRTAFSGGKRVIVDGLLTKEQTWLVAAIFGGAGLLLGAVIVLMREPTALAIGVTGALLGWSYHGPPLKLAYRGLGELDVILCYGPLIVLSTYLIQTHELSWAAFWMSLPLGIFIAAFLWVNEFPDYEADLRAGKKNLVARMGRHSASRVLPGIYALGFVLILALPWLARVPRASWLGFLALPFAVFACWHTWRRPEDFYRFRPVQPAALFAFNAYAIGVAAGVIFG